MNRLQQLRQRLVDRAAIHQSYQTVFNTPDGERVLHHLMKTANVTKPSFVPGDPHQTAFNEGARHLALSILKFVKRDHDAMLRAIEEAKDETENVL